MVDHQLILGFYFHLDRNFLQQLHFIRLLHFKHRLLTGLEWFSPHLHCHLRPRLHHRRHHHLQHRHHPFIHQLVPFDHP